MAEDLEQAHSPARLPRPWAPADSCCPRRQLNFSPTDRVKRASSVWRMGQENGRPIPLLHSLGRHMLGHWARRWCAVHRHEDGSQGNNNKKSGRSALLPRRDKQE
ncbi:unnamed protein product [Protopolystoma xenopodis]|uniref:Uncharacterized protein n=1 Tax=Protopolystoma xenopodis TaxID=117903 RepID=A0A448XNU5_9PLAT|nr:unnamed protein product [Protopolystoma xenopodis]